MSWGQWWPHDPVVKTDLVDPYLVKVEKKKVYWYCTCGTSKIQPWCDGSHKGTGFKPMMYIPQSSGYRLLCGCKQSLHKPHYDFTDLWVRANRNVPKAALFTYVALFSFGIMTTWLFHP
ncbi:CDGSH iron-sulfur domain-containing protein, putative [Plasmodium relictum]|uniref:CDGSH iron-sulfur domain-containing protein, putative n=1 Tax=Plasmodium relictum TaxID=85471 RepID=A0A1J1H2E3_PLARL|nr:CDGSH iron-sulfur domain-containing protein, putative [Plasmodium relictum]CRG99091.1 CDGSH iron-sulfur domain-containing protein, putative [Plasmodium relictum]